MGQNWDICGTIQYVIIIYEKHRPWFQVDGIVVVSIKSICNDEINNIMYLDIYNAWLPNGTFYYLNLVENIAYGKELHFQRYDFNGIGLYRDI